MMARGGTAAPLPIQRVAKSPMASLSSKAMDQEITLRIVLEKPPPGVDFGIQKGRGSIYETIQAQRSTGGDLTFAFNVVAKVASAGLVDFAGPIVQGPRGARFVYVDIGTFAGQRDTPWSRRLKVPLTGITSDLIRRGLSGASGVLEARMPGTGRDGGPSCASVKDFDGWTAAR
jgi:hypothetical protein